MASPCEEREEKGLLHNASSSKILCFSLQLFKCFYTIILVYGDGNVKMCNRHVCTTSKNDKAEGNIPSYKLQHQGNATANSLFANL